MHFSDAVMPLANISFLLETLTLGKNERLFFLESGFSLMIQK